MNWAPFEASSPWITGILLPIMPTLYPVDAIRIDTISRHIFRRLTEDLGKAGHQTCAKAWFERRESRVIDETQDNFSHVEGLANIRIYKIKQIFGRVARRSGIVIGNLLWYLRWQSQYPLTSLSNRVDPIWSSASTPRQVTPVYRLTRPLQAGRQGQSASHESRHHPRLLHQLFRQ
jgi:hypothetical protein